MLAIAGIAVLRAACIEDAPEEVESETVVPVTATPAETGHDHRRMHATGLVTPAPGAELIVVAPEPARIAEMPKAEGDAVRRGDVLVRFEIPSTAAEVVEAARRNDARRRHGSTNAQAAQARATICSTAASRRARKWRTPTARWRMRRRTSPRRRRRTTAADAVAARSIVRATFDGVVAKRSHNPGDLVEATAADAVLRVVDPRRLEVSASVPITRRAGYHGRCASADRRCTGRAPATPS